VPDTHSDMGTVKRTLGVHRDSDSEGDEDHSIGEQLKHIVQKIRVLKKELEDELKHINFTLNNVTQSACQDKVDTLEKLNKLEHTIQTKLRDMTTLSEKILNYIEKHRTSP